KSSSSSKPESSSSSKPKSSSSSFISSSSKDVSSSSSIEPSSSATPPSKKCPAKGDKGYKSNWEYLNPNIEYDCILDERDNQYYKTVEIGEQTWIAENMNYSDESKTPNLVDGNWCYENDLKNCETYGHLYTWAAAMNLDSKYNANEENPGNLVKEKHQGICPTGWHIPDSTDFVILKNYVDAQDNEDENEGTWLKAKYLWTDIDGESSTPIDGVGFAALPAGYKKNLGSDSKFYQLGGYADFWSASNGWYRGLNSGSKLSWNDYFIKAHGRSVRCLKN
ncbi:MAG: hypothetical protein HUK20_15580, partial [Fibrobacter sp.]|nr:hypothetical protein [Fibrobacter sp.]